MPPTIPVHPKDPAQPASVPSGGDLTKSEKPGGTLEMPTSDRARPLRKDTNDQRDTNDRGSGTST